MGLNISRYNVKDRPKVYDDGIYLRNIEMIPRAGLTLGVISNINLKNNMALRFVPTVSLEQRDFNYNFENDSLVVRKIEASYLNLPLMVQWRTNYYKVYRLYVLTGLQLGINMASNKKVRDDPNLLKIQEQDISIVVGAGFNLYGERIKLSPEIKYSIGLRNLYVPEFTSHKAAIRKLFSQVLSFNVNFE